MRNAIRAVAGALVVAATVPGTAQACIGELLCSKSADVSEITTYPATVTYTVELTYTQPNDRCAVASLSDSLLPAGTFTFPADPTDPNANLFWVSNPPNATQSVSYAITIDSFEECAALGGPPAADGSVTLTNFVEGAGYFEDAFSCEKAVVCRPPPTGHGCTRTPGYWKTHSEFGPAPYDATWAQLPGGASTPFFSTPKTWFEVFWTDSKGGDAWQILARAYMAARLNALAGASATDDVDAAMGFAQSFFGTYAPGTTLPKAVRAQALAWASLLDNYNNGLIGPGHCE